MTRDPNSGQPLYDPKERFLYYNDNLYQQETLRKLEARELNDQERKTTNRRVVHQSLDKQVYHHNEQKKNEV